MVGGSRRPTLALEVTDRSLSSPGRLFDAARNAFSARGVLFLPTVLCSHPAPPHHCSITRFQTSSAVDYSDAEYDVEVARTSQLFLFTRVCVTGRSKLDQTAPPPLGPCFFAILTIWPEGNF